jgi:hypothetical protein
MAHTHKDYAKAEQNARGKASSAFPGADQDAYLELAEAYRSAAENARNNETVWKDDLRERTGISEEEAQAELEAGQMQAGVAPHSEEFIRGKPLKLHPNLTK